jgi:serine/threonine protein kinase
MTWHTCFKIIKGICNGLLFLHSIPMIHMDLRPENILLDINMMPKIVGFGLSRLFDPKDTYWNGQMMFWDHSKLTISVIIFLFIYHKVNCIFTL